MFWFNLDLAMSTRPSHDNVINTLGVNMASALDQIMTVQEESYDDFLEGFTYLNKGKNKLVTQTQIYCSNHLSQMKEKMRSECLLF